MRFFVSLVLVAFATGLFAQTRPFVVEFTAPTGNRNDLPYNLVGVIDLRGGDGSLGTVHTGLTNHTRIAVLEPNAEDGLYFVMKPTVGHYNETTPKAYLNILVLQVRETILAAKEIRRIDAAATLTVETPEGPRYFGPAQFTLSRGGLTDVTAMHDEAITEALEDLTDQLAAAFLAGKTIDAPLPSLNLMPPTPTDGAYRSLFNFQLGLIDASIRLTPRNMEPISQPGEARLYATRFDRPRGIKKKAVTALFGYRLDGRDFIQVKGRFYEITRLANGRIVALLPRNLHTSMEPDQIMGALFGGAVGGIVGGLAGAALSAGSDGPNELVLYEFNEEIGFFEQVAKE